MKYWLQAAAIRALKTFAQVTLAFISVHVEIGGEMMVGIADINWAIALNIALLAALISILTSVAGIKEVEGGASVISIMRGGDDV